MKKLVVSMILLFVVPMLVGSELSLSPSRMALHNRVIPEKDIPKILNRAQDTLTFCDMTPYNAIGLQSGGTFEFAARFTPTELGPYAGWNIIAIVFHHWDASALDNVVKVYDNGTPTQPGPLITQEPYTNSTPGWVRIDLTSPVPISGSGDLWCSIEVTHQAGEYPASVDGGPIVSGKGGWIYLGGSWSEISNYGFDNNWCILAIVSDVVAQHDVSTISYDSPRVVPLNTTYSPLATVQNFGQNTETFNVTCLITPGGYSSTKTVSNLNPLSTTQVTFDPFTFSSGIYDVTVFTQLGGDENPGNDTITATVEATNWLHYDDGVANNAWAWYYPDNGWGVQFPVAQDLFVDSVAAYIWDASWPSPGGNVATFRLYDGASQPTGIRQAWDDVTIVRGDWNKFACDTTMTYYAMGDNIYFFYIQADSYPNCPAIAADTLLDGPSTMLWWYNGPSSFGVGNNGSDWLLRVHATSIIGVGEWLPVTPEQTLLKASAIIRGKAEVEFILPEPDYVQLLVYDITGRLCATLISEELPAGKQYYSFNFDLSSGVYFYNLKTESGINITRKFLLLE